VAKNFRVFFLATNCTLEYIEAADLSKPNQGYRGWLREAGQFIIKQELAQVAEVPDTVVYKIFNAQQQYRFAYFRGCGDFSFLRDAEGNQKTPPIDAAILLFIEKLATLGYGWFQVKPVNKTPGQVFSWNPIQFVTAAHLPGFAQVGLQNPITLQNPPLVYISLQNKKLLPGLNGVWLASLVGNPPSSTIQLEYQVANNADITQPQGRCRNYVTTFTAFASPPGLIGMFNAFGRRKTKDFTHRGRDQAQRIRTLV
jgi:hypothetical protein